MLVTSSGTGGTLAGVARYLKSRRAGVLTVLADPQGNAFRHGAPRRAQRRNSPPRSPGHRHRTRHRQFRVCADRRRAVTVSDAEAAELLLVACARRACRWARAADVTSRARCGSRAVSGPGTVVTILCDTGAKYRQRLFDRDWPSGLERYAEGAADFPTSRPEVQSCGGDAGARHRGHEIGLARRPCDESS